MVLLFETAEGYSIANELISNAMGLPKGNSERYATLTPIAIENGEYTGFYWMPLPESQYLTLIEWDAAEGFDNEWYNLRMV